MERPHSRRHGVRRAVERPVSRAVRAAEALDGEGNPGRGGRRDVDAVLHVRVRAASVCPRGVFLRMARENHPPESRSCRPGLVVGVDAGVRRQVCEYFGSDGREIHWVLIRAACASVADTAIHPLQDILGLDGHHRMNVPGKPNGCWGWRFHWGQFGPEPARRLASLCRLYGRDGGGNAP